MGVEIDWQPDGRGVMRAVKITTIDDRDEPMTQPVCCDSCGAIYDTGKVNVTARYADCSMWLAPCCGRRADDRRAWDDDPTHHMGYRTIAETTRRRSIGRHR